MEYKHVAYNPLWGVLPSSSLNTICATMEELGWMLSHVVSVSAYESVAVFARWRQAGEEKEEKVDVPHIGEYL